jgi:hypothetical protein
MRSRPSAWTALVLAAAAFGIVFRVWILASPLGFLDADEAVGGLMARHVLDGEFSALYWLANYGGPQETWLAAGVFAVFGSSTLAFKLVAVALFAAASLLTWRVGLRTVGERAAVLGAALLWIAPAYGVWWSTKERAYFGLGVVASLVVLLFVLRLSERDSRLEAAVLGFALGFGTWANPEVLAIAVPALAWLAFRRPRAYRLAWIAVPVALLAMWPWIVWNARNDWLSLHFSSVAGHDTTYLGRLGDLFQFTLPTWLGLRVPYSLDWLLGRAVGIALLAALAVAFAVSLRRRPAGLEPLLAILVAFPFLYASSSFAFFVAEPRYVVLAGPVLALLGGWMLSRVPVAAAAALLAGIAALSVAGLVRMEHQGLYRQIADGTRMPNDLTPVLRLLEREDADRVLANYWIAYRISFESRERIVATSTGFVRYEPHDRLVRSSDHPARVYVAGSRPDLRARAGLRAQGYRRLTAGGFAVYVR